jgi:transposase
VIQGSVRTIGMDVSDKFCSVCVLDSASGDVIEEARIRTSEAAVGRYLEGQPPSSVVIEVGPHSPWLARAIAAAGHEPIVANARQIRLVYGARRKSDRIDAEKLARLGRYDVRLLAPIRHRGAQAQADLARIRSRDVLVRTRAKLVSHARSVVKAFGARLPRCTTEVFHHKVREHVPADLLPALAPVLDTLAHLTASIKEIDAALAERVATVYPEAELLRQVPGVGPITSLAFVLTLEDPHRFAQSREVGPYLGLAPGRRQSGEFDPASRITKTGDTLLRRLLVQCAHQIVRRPNDTDLKRVGERHLARGAHRNKAVTAVARKLAVLLHHLWVTGEVYEPLHNHRRRDVSVPAAA